MKQKIKGLISVALCLVLIIQSASINAATKVKINKKTASIYIGETVQLKIKGTKKKVTWKSSNNKVATVTSKGRVKGINKGTTKIIATVSKKKYTCKVTVKSDKNNNNNDTNKPTQNSNTTSPTPVITPQPTPEVPVVSLGGLKAYNLNELYTLENGYTIKLRNIWALDTSSSLYGIYSCQIAYDTKPKSTYPYSDEDENMILQFRVFDVNGKTYYYENPKNVLAYSHIDMISLGKAKPAILELVIDKEKTEANYKDTLDPNAMHWIINNSNLK